MMKPIYIFLSGLMIAASLAGCDKPKNAGSPTAQAPAAGVEAPKAPEPEPWIVGNELGDWKPLEAASQAKVSVKDGVLYLGSGDGVSGVVYTGKREIPVVDYELTWEAMKIDGVDFFGAATFPVRDAKTCVTLINGGWGGGVTGISCIDEMSANENNTQSTIGYKDGQWYKFRVLVTAEMMVGYVDDKQIFKVLIKDKKVGLRSGDIELCAPFGFATYMTKGAVKNIQFRPIKSSELKPDADTF